MENSEISGNRPKKKILIFVFFLSIFASSGLKAEDAEMSEALEQFKKDSKSSEIEYQIINEIKEYLQSSPTESIVIPRFLIQGRELWTFKMKTRKTIEDFSKIIDQELEKLD